MGERALLARRVEPVAGPVPGGGGCAHSAHPHWHLRAAVTAVQPGAIAEDFAVLDNISGGRIDLPVGVGSATEEFHTFGVPFGERLGRMFEGLSVIERCFTGEKFSHHGKYYDFPDVRMTTPTVQQPRTPTWVASMGEQSVRRTGRRGYHLAAGAGRGHAGFVKITFSAPVKIVPQANM